MNIEIPKDLLKLGYCIGAHGIKGGFTFVLFNTQDSVLKESIEVILYPDSDKSSIPLHGSVFKISSISFGNKVIVYLDGVTTRNIVDEMIPFSVYIKKELLPKLSSNEYYLDDLLSLVVIDNNSKEKIGVVEDFYENGAQLVLVIRGTTETFDVIFNDHFIKKVDIDSKTVEILVPEYIE